MKRTVIMITLAVLFVGGTVALADNPQMGTWKLNEAGSKLKGTARNHTVVYAEAGENVTITIDGVDAWAEHGWAERDVAIGDAVLRVAEPTPRCVVTTRDPDTGRRDAPVLKALAGLRGKDDVTFGVWCDVVAPGRVRVGDATVLAASGR